MAVEITCINKDGGDHYDPYEAIERFGWVNSSTGKRGNSTLQAMIDYLNGNNQAYVLDSTGSKKVYLFVATSRHGNKYVKTEPDGNGRNNLLELDECIIK